MIEANRRGMIDAVLRFTTVMFLIEILLFSMMATWYIG